MWQILFSASIGPRYIGCLWLCGCLCFQAPLASAEEPATVAGWMATASRLYKQGKAFALKRAFDRALRSYQRALRAVKKAQGLGGVTPKLRHVETTMLYIIARTFEYQSQWCSANTFYARCLRRKPRSGLRTKATSALAALQPRLRFALRLSSTPPGAAFSIRSLTGQEAWQRLPVSATLGCGSFLVRAQLPGFRVVRKTVETFGAFPEAMHFAMQPLQTATLPRSRGPVGTVTRPGGRPVAPQWPRVVAWSGVATAALTGLAGIIMVGVARSEFASVESKLGDTFESIDQIQAQRDRGVNLQNAGFVFWGLSVVAGGVAIWGFLSQPNKKSIPSTGDTTPMTRLP